MNGMVKEQYAGVRYHVALENAAGAFAHQERQLQTGSHTTEVRKRIHFTESLQFGDEHISGPIFSSLFSSVDLQALPS